MASFGKIGCNCIDRSEVLSSLSDRPCTMPDGENGSLTRDGFCVPYSFGTECILHDLYHHPKCQEGLDASRVPSYCFRAWCYVDRDTCKRESSESMYASDIFPSSNLFYSYSTCNSTAEDWLIEAEKYDSGVMGGASIYATIPKSYQIPYLYKRSASGEILLELGDEYYDDSIPFEGLYINYMKDVVRISKGDIGGITYTHTSKAALDQNPSSSFTAAVQDVENGLVDMSLAGFWITAGRLKMTAFTVPLFYAKTVLVIPTPGTNQSLGHESSKVMEPFTLGLWLVALAIIAVSACLSVWFSEPVKLAKNKHGRRSLENNSKYRRKTVYVRLALDAFLEKGLFFCSGGVEQDAGASLPHKMLMFGFGGFILIAVSAYVANLAAFLTRSGTESFAGTIEEVVVQNVPMCAHPALKDELLIKWPSANFVWSDNEWEGVVDDYDAGKCKVLAVGQSYFLLDGDLVQKFCVRGLLFTQSLIIEVPVAFPTKPEIASGLSYWMYQGEKYKGVSWQNTVEEYVLEAGGPPCPVELSQVDYHESNDYTQISPKNMILPIIFFLVCATIAIIFQLIHKCNKGKGDLTGRTSSLELITDKPAKSFRRRASDIIETFARRNSRPANNNQEKTDVEGEMYDFDIKSHNEEKTDVEGEMYDSDIKSHNEEKTDVEGEMCDLDVGKSVTFNVPGDDFHNNDGMAHQVKGLMGDSVDINTMDIAEIPVTSNDENVNHQILTLVESGVIDDVLKCYQEMKRLKKSA